jgi:alanyl-tRNA synthetase
LGEHAWQAGARKDVDKSRLDISHYEHLTEEQVRTFEDMACRIITNNVLVETNWMPREKAEAAYGFRLYQGGAVPGREIRVVKIGDWDVEACGGTHCTRTGEVGFLKILRVERPQDGVERLVFATGPQALKYVQENEILLKKTARELNVPVEDLDKAAEDLVSEKRKMSRELDVFRSQGASDEAKKLYDDKEHSTSIEGLKLIIQRERKPEEEDYVTTLSSRITESYPTGVFVAALRRENSVRFIVSSGAQAIKEGVDAGQIAGYLAKVVDGGGGGKPYFGQGGGTSVKKTDEALNTVEKFIRRLHKNGERK